MCQEDILVWKKINNNLMYREEAHIIENPTEKEMINSIKKHLQYCSNYNFNIGLHIGEIVLKEHINRNIFKESYYDTLEGA